MPGCREAVVAGETGLLVPPRDVRALAQAIAILAGDPKLRRRMGEAGRARVCIEFADAVIANATLAVCQAEMERRR